jgi:hypothetical protein
MRSIKESVFPIRSLAKISIKMQENIIFSFSLMSDIIYADNNDLYLAHVGSIDQTLSAIAECLDNTVTRPVSNNFGPEKGTSEDSRKNEERNTYYHENAKRHGFFIAGKNYEGN